MHTISARFVCRIAWGCLSTLPAVGVSCTWMENPVLAPFSEDTMPSGPRMYPASAEAATTAGDATTEDSKTIRFVPGIHDVVNTAKWNCIRFACIGVGSCSRDPFASKGNLGQYKTLILDILLSKEALYNVYSDWNAPLTKNSTHT